MATKLKIYRVDEWVDGTEATKDAEATPARIVNTFLVRAPIGAQAVRHVAKRFKCKLATQDDLAKLCAAGVSVQSIDNSDAGE